MLVILTTHPIQYQVPLWRKLAARGQIDFQVWYMSDHSLRPSLDKEFGRVFAWDLDLMSGYPYRFLEAPRRDITTFRGARLPNFAQKLRSVGATALLVNGWQSAAYWDAMWAARRARVPIWLRGESNDLSQTPWWKRPIKKLVLGYVFDRVERFLTIGTANERLYLQYGVSPERLRRAPYGVDNERFARQAAALSAERGAIREYWGIPRDAFCVLFAGKLIPKKRPSDVVDAVASLGSRRQWHILFAGDGEMSGSLEAKCDVRFADGVRRSSAHHRSPAASFAGFLNQSEMAKAYVAADCLVLPSDSRETWGLVVNEAMASGLPCIASDACGCAEDLVAPIDAQLVFRVGDPDGLSRAIAHLADRPPPKERLREHVARFSLDASASEIVSLAAETSLAGREQFVTGLT